MNSLVDILMQRIKEKPKRIVFIGDVLLDVWVHGDVTTCQDDCDKFVETSRVQLPGGAANAERSISNWNNPTSLYGYYLSDCPVKQRYVNGSGKIVYRADYDGLPTRAERYKWARELAIETISRAGAVLISDYDKGFISKEFLAKIVSACQWFGIPCIADCKREPSFYSGCILKCNTEYQHKYNKELCQLVFDSQQGEKLIVTGGALNPIVWEGGGPIGLGCDFPPVKCVNHVGAGDCFATHFALALAYKFTFVWAATIAHSASRVYVQHPHNCPPYSHQVDYDLSLRT